MLFKMDEFFLQTMINRRLAICFAKFSCITKKIRRYTPEFPPFTLQSSLPTPASPVLIFKTDIKSLI